MLCISLFTETWPHETACKCIFSLTHSLSESLSLSFSLSLRVDVNKIIKVSDFGLSMDIYEKNYFRPTGDQDTKMPIKWMAIESFNDGVYSEKSDVV